MPAKNCAYCGKSVLWIHECNAYCTNDYHADLVYSSNLSISAEKIKCFLLEAWLSEVCCAEAAPTKILKVKEANEAPSYREKVGDIDDEMFEKTKAFLVHYQTRDKKPVH